MSGTPVSVDEAAHANVHDDAEGEEGEEDRGAAVAEQRERYSCDRHETDDHANVNSDLKYDDRDHPHDDEAAGQIGGSLGVLDETHENEKIKKQNADGADEAVFFTESSEDEIGIWDGEKVTLGLRALVGAFAPNTAGADGYQGLTDLIAGAARVGVGVDESIDARLLVGLKVLAGLPGNAADKGERKQDDGDLFEADAAEEEAADEDR